MLFDILKYELKSKSMKFDKENVQIFITLN